MTFYSNRLISVGVASVICSIPVGYGGQTESEFKKLDGASRVFGVTEGNTAAYRLNLLQEKLSSPLGNNLDLFEREFPKLNNNEQFDLVLLILANYDFDGEYSIRFRVMIEKAKPFIAERLTHTNKERLRNFVTQYGAKFSDFSERCKRFFGVTF